MDTKWWIPEWLISSSWRPRYHTRCEQTAPSPFDLKIATKDWHPADHISFASNHEGKKPYTDFTTIINPENPVERYETRLWPDHCIQNTKGAELVLDWTWTRLRKWLRKDKWRRWKCILLSTLLSINTGWDSGLAGYWRTVVSPMSSWLFSGGLLRLCYGLRRCTGGFKTYIVEEGTKPVDESFWKRRRRNSNLEGLMLWAYWEKK